MVIEYLRVRRTLLTLIRMAYPAWKRSGEALARHFIERKFPLDEKRLGALIPRQVIDEVSIPRKGRTNEGLILPPLREGPRFIPILCMAWLPTRPAPPRGSLRLFFVSCKEYDSAIQQGIDHPFTAFGFHFDDREGNDNWDFSHCQISDDPAPYDNLFDSFPSWFPARVPRIPLASLPPSMETLLLCLLVSLYGANSNEVRGISTSLGDDAKVVLGWLRGNV